MSSGVFGKWCGATEFLYDGLNPVQELNGNNPPSPTAELLTGLNIDEYFTRTDSNGAMSLLTDALGSTLALTDSSGGINTSYTYEPFGKATISGSNANPYQFTGRENDGTGLYYYRARYYSPIFQRFIAQDPGATIETLNSYAYVLNDPINLTDPLGLFPIPWGLPINILLGGGSCGLVGGAVGGVVGGVVLGGGPIGGAIGAAAGSTFGKAICNDPCAGALNCNEDQMLPPTPPPASGPTCSEHHP